MKDELYTIPLTDAFKAPEECPFCYIQRNLEQSAIEFILGESYMESDIREQTDNIGFCRPHLKKMYEYGNHLGNAWILSTYLKRVNQELKTVMAKDIPAKPSFFPKRKKNSITDWIRREESSCYFCNHVAAAYERYLDTFFYLLKREKDFLLLVEASKGFCLPHFGDIMEGCETKLSPKEREVFLPVFLKLMEENMGRVEADINWFIEKYDYRNKDADWKNSKDAVPRTMQKIAGGYPGDVPFKSK